MSKNQKPKKARKPNIPLATGPMMAKAGGAETATVPASTHAERFSFDYTHIKKDLSRIFTLAGIFIAVLVALAFILPNFIK